MACCRVAMASQSQRPKKRSRPRWSVAWMQREVAPGNSASLAADLIDHANRRDERQGRKTLKRSHGAVAPAAAAAAAATTSGGSSSSSSHVAAKSQMRIALEQADAERVKGGRPSSSLIGWRCLLHRSSREAASARRGCSSQHSPR
mmetsp:Transcript_20288/g.51251  ORF Transcript_20288/g.51251 Transcript_20288/m.51251 type:complete len:146 (-) Transcript_20288:855-1292(-)